MYRDLRDLCPLFLISNKAQAVRLQRHLNHSDLPAKFTEWGRLAQDHAGWHKLVTTPPFAIGKPFVRQPRGDARVTPEDRRRAVAQRAAGIAERRVIFDGNNSS